MDKRDHNANRTPRRTKPSHDDEEFTGTSPNCPQPMGLSTSPAPPYMPIQGHRRMQAFEKRKKDKGCTQQ